MRLNVKELKKIKQAELNEILRKHKLWLKNEECGEKADLQGADLLGANLLGANLQGADLQGANLDYSCWPLWCRSLRVHIDDRQAVQLLYHLISNVAYSKNTSDEVKSTLLTEDIVKLANQFHHVEECGRIEA